SSPTPATISTGDSFYLSGEISGSHLSFLPAPGFSGTVLLPFTGWSITGAQFVGTVQVNVSGEVTKTNVLYTTTGKPVQFSAYDFYNEGGGQPVSLRLNALPYSTQGKLYYQYTDPTHYSWLATAGMQYGFVSDPLLGNLTFVPKAGFHGTVTLPYTATNSGGGTYTGEIKIVVDPTPVSEFFYDLQGYSTDVTAAVDFLYSQGVVNGLSTGRYGPSQGIRRGDFCLMLYRAFQFSSNGSAAGFSDVPDSAYYAQAVNILRSQGIVTGTGSNSFQPNAALSRQDAAVMIQRTLKAAGLNADNGTEANLAQFTDSAQISSYARGALSGLVQQGFWPTSGNMMNPKRALTRADMAVLLHRAIAQ
nr:S-layer homology domain-containing protein [Oscillospiraceae bacterium]